jgi:hypothetical protein
MKIGLGWMTDLERCDQEIAEAIAGGHDSRAYLVTLGVEDWRAERMMIVSGRLPGKVRVFAQKAD